LPNKIEKRGQSIASFALLLPLVGNYVISILYGGEFRVEFLIEVIISIGFFIILEQIGFNISKESEVTRAEKMKAYGKFGMSDMSLASSEKTLDEIGGYNDVKTELKEAILIPLKKKEIAYTYGMKPPSGILLFGPPGTGKTMMMRALAKELKFNFIEVRCAQILSEWVGEAEKNVIEVFANARKNAPTVLFFDEIDSLARKRGTNKMDTVGANVLTTLLQEMDGGVKSDKSVIVIGSTNIPDELDPAILRPGRFDKIIYMHLPDLDARKEIFKVHLSKVPVSEDMNLEILAKKTERFSGADIKNIVNEAKERAAKEAIVKNKVVPITQEHIVETISDVKPSTAIAQLDKYEQFKLDFERRSTSKKKENKKEERGVKWEDVVGLDKVKESLLETIQLPLLHEKEMKELDIKPTKGILLFGPPGTGKTMIVKAAANELKASFQVLSGAELMQKGYTQAVTVIKEAFNRARENSPSIIFIDEIETFAPSRGTSVNSEILGQFLSEMDGIKELKGVLVIGATNKPANLDSAILRPGRFDKIFYIPQPHKEGRKEMFKLNLGKIAQEMDLEKLAQNTEGFSGADIAAICQNIKMSKLKEKISGKEGKVNTETALELITKRKPSITRELLLEYERFLQEYGERN
jgi:SpoVK/Ycf46/Vps4 family AAA+-type ATPase